LKNFKVPLIFTVIIFFRKGKKMNHLGWIKRACILFLSFVYLNAFWAQEVLAKESASETTNTSANNSPQNIIPSPPTVDAKGFILMDANTGAILAGQDIDTRMAPASLTKLMTLYQIASALKAKRVHITDRVAISEKAWRTGGSKMFIKVGDQVPINSLIQGIAVVSGNDACVAIAEHLAGTEGSFTDLMNRSADMLGMKNTHYTDATGLPDPKHYTSPRDLAILTKAIINQFPEYYGWYSQKEFIYNGIKQPNRDLLLWRDSSIEGMKTGHTEDAGYCLVSTASRNGMRLISVIMGSSSTRKRAESSLALLNYGFRFYESKKIFAGNTPIKQPRVWFGKAKNVPVGLTKDLFVTVPTGQLSHMQALISINEWIKAPIQKGQPLGKVTLKLKDKDYLSLPLVALQNDPKGNIFSRLSDRVWLFINKMLHRSSD
jgi:serine-type D-Ala-D-Ala carboxypeptidase (penicillin-binding protein 5/6)